MEIRPRGPARYAEHLADLDVSETFDVVQHDHRPRSFGKLRKRAGKAALELRVLRGIPKGRLKRVTQLLSRPDFSAPENVQRSIRNDAIHPCSETLRRIESFNRSPGTDESFLNCIFCILVNGHDRPCYKVRAPLVHADEPREGIFIACASRFGQRAFLIRDTHRAA
jgi:hypothetical protein